MRLLALCFLCRVERYRQFQVDVLVVALLSDDAWLLAFYGKGMKGWSIGLAVCASTTRNKNLAPCGTNSFLVVPTWTDEWSSIQGWFHCLTTWILCTQLLSSIIVLQAPWEHSGPLDTRMSTFCDQALGWMHYLYRPPWRTVCELAKSRKGVFNTLQEPSVCTTRQSLTTTGWLLSKGRFLSLQSRTHSSLSDDWSIYPTGRSSTKKASR